MAIAEEGEALPDPGQVETKRRIGLVAATDGNGSDDRLLTAME